MFDPDNFQVWSYAVGGSPTSLSENNDLSVYIVVVVVVVVVVESGLFTSSTSGWT